MSQLNNKMKAQANILSQKNNDINAEITVSTSIYNNAEITTIGNGNHMQAKAEIITPPLSTLITSSTYDTYTRSDHDTISYGQSQTMYTGKLNNVDTNAFIFFDINKLLNNNTNIIKSAKLRLYCINKSNASITLYEVDKNWQENSTTYLNQPNKTIPITQNIDITNEQSYVDIDLSDYIIKTFKSENNTGICISLTNPNLSAKGFYSKESSSSLKPQLNIQYIDLNDMVETNDIYGNIKVNQKVNNDINAETTVYVTHMTTYNDKDSNIIISNENQSASIDILQNNDINSNINVYYNDLSENICEITPYRKETNYNNANIDIVDHITTYNDKDSNIIISNENQNSGIDVIDHINDNNDINCNIQTISSKQDKNEINSNINVYKKEQSYINSDIKIIKNSDTESEITIYHLNNSDKDSNIIISNENQISNINIIDHINDNNDINCNIQVNKQSVFDTNSNINIITKINSFNDINAETNIYQKLDNTQLAEITVSNNSDIDSSIYISKPFIDAEINVIDYVKTNTENNAEININNHFNNDVNSYININQKIINEKDSTIIVTDTKFSGYIDII